MAKFVDLFAKWATHHAHAQICAEFFILVQKNSIHYGTQSKALGLLSAAI